MSRLPAPPHGGRLVERVVDAARLEAAAARGDLPILAVPDRLLPDLEGFATGALSPLRGFLGERDLAAVLSEGRLASGRPWTVPIVLDLPRETAPEPGSTALLADARGAPVAVLDVEARWTFDRAAFARGLYGTEDPRHPGVAALAAFGDVLVSGPVLAARRSPFAGPREVRAALASRGWRAAAGYQTRNPPHRGHEFVHKVALSLVDGLVVMPALGPKKADDFPDDMLLASWAAALAAAYPAERVLFAPVPYAMRYAGPREAVHHAILRQNFGCTHFIVGRDHAGVGGFYAPGAAIAAFEDYPDLAIEPLAIAGDHGWCPACGGVESERTCPHGEAARIPFSGTRVRAALREGREIPPEIMRPEVARVLSAPAPKLVAPPGA
ncbi:MAG TPA: sulfate adenylyltransferase [Candidatus Thermoplasmatota archaeon]|nr:sulfate adenylyltransferase [Candidatus Thermoplasmatota archaeon]